MATSLGRVFSLIAGVAARDAAAGGRRHRQRRLHRLLHRHPRTGGLRRLRGRRAAAHAGAGGGRAKKGIRLVAVAAGTVATDDDDQVVAESPDPEAMRRALAARQLIGRAGTPEEIANAILFLASEEASVCAGTILLAVGGLVVQ